METTYAAFCGIQNVILMGPRDCSFHGTGGGRLIEYTRAIEELLRLTTSTKLAIQLDMQYETKETAQVPLGHLGHFARKGFSEGRVEGDMGLEPYSSWDSWDLIRSLCNYNPRLSVGMSTLHSIDVFVFLHLHQLLMCFKLSIPCSQ